MLILDTRLLPLKLIIAQALKVLKQGGVVVYPTETAYGLAADFFNPKARRKVYAIKGRSFDKPLSVIAANLNQVKQLTVMPKMANKLATRHWPGPLTLILKTQGRAKTVQPTLALRLSSQLVARQLVKAYKRPLTATSANLSGQAECYDVGSLLSQLAKTKTWPDLVIDAGRLPKNKVTTIADLTTGEVKVVRRGQIKL